VPSAGNPGSLGAAPPRPDHAVVLGKRVEIDCATAERCLAGLTYAEAEELLSWLDANGFRHQEVGFPDRQRFVVRWRPRRGY
jgi:hypothetical protein